MNYFILGLFGLLGIGIPILLIIYITRQNNNSIPKEKYEIILNQDYTSRILQEFNIGPEGGTLNIDTKYNPHNDTFAIKNINFYSDATYYYYYFQLVINVAGIVDYKYQINKKTRAFSGNIITISTETKKKLVLTSITLQNDKLTTSQFGVV